MRHVQSLVDSTHMPVVCTSHNCLPFGGTLNGAKAKEKRGGVEELVEAIWPSVVGADDTRARTCADGDDSGSRVPRNPFVRAAKGTIDGGLTVNAY